MNKFRLLWSFFLFLGYICHQICLSTLVWLSLNLKFRLQTASFKIWIAEMRSSLFFRRKGKAQEPKLCSREKGSVDEHAQTAVYGHPVC